MVNKSENNIEAVIEKQLAKNIEVIKSLRDYDDGKKDISITNVIKHFPNIKITSE